MDNKVKVLSQYKINHGLIKAAYREAWLDVGRGITDSVLVAGVGRSGTTWLGDVIASATKARKLFEPFVVGSDGKFVLTSKKHESSGIKYLPNYSQYISPESGGASEHFAEVEKILTGRVRSRWTEQGMQPGIFKKRIIKDIRLNLMLGWLTNCWPELKVVYVVRNPISTVTSMLERSSAGWGFDWNPEYVLCQSDLMSGSLKPYKKILEAEHPHDSRLMLKWCVENHLALEQISNNSNSTIVYYDDLIKNRSLWGGIFQHIGWQWNPELFEKSVNVRSRTSAPSRAPQKPQLDNNRVATLLNLASQFNLSKWVVT